MNMEIWIAVLLLFGGPDKSEPMLHTISGPPMHSIELCRQDVQTKGLEVYYKYKAPAGWKLMGAFCSPLLNAYKIDLGEVAFK